MSRSLGIRNWGFDAAATEGNDEIIDGLLVLDRKRCAKSPEKPRKERKKRMGSLYHPPSPRVSKVGECMLEITLDGGRNWSSSGLDDPELEKGERGRERHKAECEISLNPWGFLVRVGRERRSMEGH